jgi:uncharacterized protein YjbI with pentapeptide repeats
MKIALFHFALLVICILSATNAFASEQDTKPTREQIIEFLEDYKKNHPITDEKQKWDNREKINLVEQFGTDFTGLDLSGIDLRDGIGYGIVASGADFSGCNFQGTYLFGSILTGCNFTNADLTDAQLRFCALGNADFSRAKLDRTGFGYNSMRGVLFTDLDARTCDFSSVDFREAKLMRTNFTQAVFRWGNDFQNADLTEANLSDADLSGVQFCGANLKNVSFRSSDLHLADFSGANLEGTDFTGADIDAAIFVDVKGIDEASRQALEKQAARWWYDLKENFADCLTVAFYPSYLFTLILATICSIVGLIQKHEKHGIIIGHALSRFFVTAFFLNGFAVFSAFCTFLMMFSGGHAVRQMSGNMNVWSAWLQFFPIPALGLCFCIGCSFVLLLAVFVSLFKWRENRPWRLFFYMMLTLIHCLFAFNWLMMFMPDA